MKKQVNRREFIQKSSCALAISALPLAFNCFIPKNLGASVTFEKEAMFYKKKVEKDKVVQCEICPNDCKLAEGERSKCFVREVRDGKLYTLTYEYPNVLLTEPIEKGPIYHINPGAKLFAVASAGCNLKCKYCQNWQLALSKPDDKKRFHVTPAEAVQKAKGQKCKGMVFTYSDPVVNYEYVLETAKLAKKAKMMNIMVTAGFIHEKPLIKLSKYIDGFIVGLKGFEEKYYNEIIEGKLQPVLNTLMILKKQKKWFEIINLVVPGLNDNMKTVKNMNHWILKNLGNKVPIHFARFTPDYKLTNLPPTPQVTLEEARKIAMDIGIKYVYINNLPGHEGNNTYCHNCGRLIVRRLGYTSMQNNLTNGKCKFCKANIPGKWQS